MQTSVHAIWRLVGDFNSVLQYSCRDHMLLRAWCWFSSDEDSVAGVTVQRCCLQKGFQSGQPTRHQVNILEIQN